MQHAKEDKEALQQIKACFPHLAVVGVYADPCFGNEGSLFATVKVSTKVWCRSNITNLKHIEY